MNGRLRLLVFSLSLAAACAHPPAPPRLAPGQAIAVLPPNNRTGNPLFVSGASFLDRYVFHAEVVTVGDVLAGEARFQLAERGFRVIPGQAIAAATKGQTPESPTAAGGMASRGKLDALALYLEIRQWEPDGSIETTFVIVGLSLSLVDPATGNVVWRLDRRPAPVATPGEVTLESAYGTAARKVIAEVLQPFGQ